MTPAITYPAATIRRVGEDLDLDPAEDDRELRYAADFELEGRDDLLIFDSAGKTWRTSEYRKTLMPPRGFWQWLLSPIAVKTFEMEYTFVDTPQLSLDEMKDVICNAITDDRLALWAGQEIEAGVGATLKEGDDLLGPLKIRVRSARDVPEMLLTLFPKEFG